MNKKIKILYIHHGASQGGAPRSLSFLIEKLDKSVFEPVVLCMNDKDNIELFESVGAKVIFDDRLGAFHGSEVTGMSIGLFYYNIRKVMPTYKYIKQHIHHINPDIVHLNSTCLFVAAKAIKDVKDIPVICHIREPLLKNVFGDILKFMNRKYIDFFIAIDEFDANTVTQTRHKLEIIYNFVDMKAYNSNIKANVFREDFHLDKNSLVFLSLARVIPQNGVSEVISAVEKFSIKEDNFHFFFVGDNPSDNSNYANEMRSRAEKHNNIHILPFNKDVVNLIASADVMIAPFTRPHFARSIIEAAAMGKPSIGTDIGGPQELIINQQTGLLFDLNDFKQFVDCCRKMQDMNRRQQMGLKALDFAKKNFNAEINSNKTIDIYYKLIGEKK